MHRPRAAGGPACVLKAQCCSAQLDVYTQIAVYAAVLAGCAAGLFDPSL
jgi:hypothetical protein